MANVTWTDKQQAVIDARDHKLLVSAAAGSGKTAVMVERIVEIVSDSDHPVDIDRLLIVTFTNAAAAEMKDRIMTALEEKVEKEPGNQHILRQLSRVMKAQITTIHSFCLNLIREHYMEIDLDPGFRIGEEGEISLLEQDALGEVLEEAYEKQEEAFLAFLECYAPGKSDQEIENLILRAYTFARSGKDPEGWLMDAKKVFSFEEEDIRQSDWMLYLQNEMQYDVKRILEQYETLYLFSQDDSIPEDHRRAVATEYESLLPLKDEDTMEHCVDILSQFSKYKVTKRAGKQHDKVKTKQLMDQRKELHVLIDQLVTKKMPASLSSIKKELRRCQEPMEAFIELVMAFMDRVQEKKKEKNLLDFSDLEQYALKILSQKEDGKLVPSKTALERKAFYSEIYVDEYQDTNDVQEAIISLITGDSMGKYNLFTVGDLKQSIYGFRQAKPELFIRRYEQYQEESKEHELIELQNNFRSRKEILNGTNYLFRHIMTKEFGGINYDRSVYLYPGRDFPETDFDTSVEMNLLNIDSGETSFTDVEAEGAMIGNRIRELVDDPTANIEYRDIVILLRTVSGWGETIQEQLNKMGIPAFCESRKGSFTTIEIQTVLSCLKVLDNRRQDIPFAAFLRAPFIGISGEEMVWMTSLKKNDSGEKYCLWEHMKEYIQNGNNQQIVEKLKLADEFLHTFTQKKKYLSMPDLIREILDATNYYHLIGAMPYGERRQANVRMLIQKAKAFEQGSYKGLFRFVRYMEQLKEYDIDYGEANVQGEHENLVRIMSIHKSKGLEYPVVFVSGLSKGFNMRDTSNPVLMHSEYHIAPDAIRLETREKWPTTLKKMIALKMKEEIMTEEMRILYVALTRAKEKLILTGTISKLANKIDANRKITEDLYAIKNGKCYLDWILLALKNHPAMEPLYRSYFPSITDFCPEEECVDAWKIKIVSPEDLVADEVDDFIEKSEKKKTIVEKIEQYNDLDELESMKKEFAWEYPEIESCGYKVKYSVSEIKQKKAKIDPKRKLQKENMVPAFLQKEKKISGAARGTAVHRFMELLDFTVDHTEETLKEHISKWISEGKLEPEFEDQIPVDQIAWFLRSRIGKVVKKAADRENIYKEKQFVVGIPLCEMTDTTKSHELSVVQGIIDLYVIVDDEIILIDYKTDRVKRGQEMVLVDHYKAQMELYKKALEQMTGLPVTKGYLVSFTLKKNISIDFD